jgi:hypothetical protein
MMGSANNAHIKCAWPTQTHSNVCMEPTLIKVKSLPSNKLTEGHSGAFCSLWRLRQEDCQLEASLDYIVTP